MKTNAKVLIRNKYSWDKIIIDYLNMYKKEALKKIKNVTL